MGYLYHLDVLAEDGRSLERLEVAPDWQAALAWVHFEGIRAGRLPAVTARGPSHVEPVWDAQSGPPGVSAFRVEVRAPDGNGSMVHEIPRTYLRPLANDAVSRLIERKVLQEGDTFRWALRATTVPDGPPPADDDAIILEEIASPLPFDRARLESFLERSAFQGLPAQTAHMPVFVPEAVLDEAERLARAAGDVETGGVLVGKLHRDDGELFLEITAQLPARHTVAAAAKLTFTGETWAAVRDAVALRRKDELLAGWWHYHPGFCRLRGCPPERRRTCSAAAPFFSAEDVHLHATCFPAGHHVALLVSEGDTEALERSLFGWWEGSVVARGFHVLGGTTHATNATHGD